MIRHTLIFLLGAMLILPGLAEAPKKKADAKTPEKNAAQKELTREELAKLGGFEPAPVDPPDPAALGPVNVTLEVLMVSLPDALAVPLVESFKDPAKAEAAYQKLLGLVEAKKAQITGWPRLVTKSGVRAVAENVQEVRYAAQFDPPKPPAPAVPGAAAAPAAPKAGPELEAVLPTSFETRNAGVVLEAEPNLVDSKTIDLQLAVQHVRLIGWDNVTLRENGTTKITMPQPRFDKNLVNQNLSLRVGQRVLVGTHRLAAADGMMELFVLGGSVTPAGKEKGKGKGR
jgi:hypothetical protein